MHSTFNVKKLGLAVGSTWALLYLACTITMATVGQSGMVKFINSLWHGLDVSPIIRMNITIWQALAGIIETFILGWLVGACITAIYNATANVKQNKKPQIHIT